MKEESRRAGVKGSGGGGRVVEVRNVILPYRRGGFFSLGGRGRRAKSTACAAMVGLLVGLHL